MSFANLSPQDFIQQTFAPLIAVTTSQCVEDSCKRNNLTLIELLKPFSQTSVEGYIRDPSGNVVTSKNLRIAFCDLNSRPPPPQIARQYFNQAVSSNIHDQTKEILIDDCKLDIPVTVPWYDAWRHTFLQVQYPSDHEFVKHYIGCLIVVSSEDSSPLQIIAEKTEKINDQILNGDHKLAKWFGPPNSIIFTYLLLHDNAVSDPSKSVLTFESMKARYDPKKCFTLSINSRKPNDGSTNLPDPWIQYINTNISYKDEIKETDPAVEAVEAADDSEETLSPSTPVIAHPLSPVTEDGMSISEMNDPGVSKGPASQHGMCLTAEDISKIKQFVNDFFINALIPHFEHHIQLLNEQVMNKKGVSRSLLSATKRWFGTTKPGAPGNHISPTAIAYSSDSHELQLRRLGDLCFMIGHYQLAYNAYHSAKRDFSVDCAWLHYAGALEMAALSAFMANTDNLSRKVVDYFEDSITTYQNSCRLNQCATRATILSAECLRGKGLYGEAAKQLIRMASEDSDLRSAVLLEQAAYCFLSSKRPVMYRKYAFHMVLAGNRFSKASHKNHSMRCYYQAYQVYANKNWMIAEDHILYTIGKHAAQLKLLKNAFDALSLLVTRSSQQSPVQQQLFLKDYIVSVQKLLNAGVEIELNLPLIENHLTQIHLSVPIGTTSNQVSSGCPLEEYLFGSNNVWLKLEEKLANFAAGHSIMIFIPTVEVLTSKSKDTSSPIAVCGEMIGVCVCLRNPLHTALKLTSMHLTWDFTTENGQITKTGDSSCAKSDILPDVVLNPDTECHVLLTVVPNTVGALRITGLNYVIHDTSSGCNVNGSQSLTTLKKGKVAEGYCDKRLQISIIEKAPHLKVHFTGVKEKVFCNEIFPITINLKNTGELSISRILLISSSNCSIWVQECPSDNSDSIFNIPLNGDLKTNDSMEVNVLIQPCHKKGMQNLELLFYYESGIQHIKPRYRLVKYTWPITVIEAFNLTAFTSKSNAKSEQDALNIRLQIDSESVTKTFSKFKMKIESVSILSANWEIGKWVIDPSGVMEEDQRLFILIQALRKKVVSEKGTISTNYLLAESKNDVPYLYFLPKINNLTQTCNIDIVCVVNWKLETSTNDEIVHAKGQEHIPLNNSVSSSQNLSVITPNMFPLFRDLTKPLQNTKLVSCRIHLPQRVRHQFVSKRLCTIPVILHLHNCSEHKLFVKVSTTLSKMPDAPDVPDDSLSSCFSWVGQTSFTKVIEGFGDTGISLVAAVTTTGAYDFSSGLSVEVKVLNEYVVQMCNFDSITVIY